MYTSPGVLHEVLSNKPVFDLQNLSVSGDVQISVYVSSKMQNAERVAKSGNEKGILFTFFFHTAFTSGGDLRLSMKMIDKATKNKKIGKIKKPYNEAGYCQLLFEQITT